MRHLKLKKVHYVINRIIKENATTIEIDALFTYLRSESLGIIKEIGDFVNHDTKDKKHKGSLFPLAENYFTYLVDLMTINGGRTLTPRKLFMTQENLMDELIGVLQTLDIDSEILEKLKPMSYFLMKRSAQSLSEKEFRFLNPKIKSVELSLMKEKNKIYRLFISIKPIQNSTNSHAGGNPYRPFIGVRANNSFDFEIMRADPYATNEGAILIWNF